MKSQNKKIMSWRNLESSSVLSSILLMMNVCIQTSFLECWSIIETFVSWGVVISGDGEAPLVTFHWAYFATRETCFYRMTDDNNYTIAIYSQCYKRNFSVKWKTHCEAQQEHDIDS